MLGNGNGLCRREQCLGSFIQAFDTPYPLKAPLGDRYVHDYTKGWWKLQQKSDVNITADSFEEQFKDLTSDSVNSNKSIYRTARLGTTCEACGRKNVSMIVAIVILSVLCFGLIMPVVYLYNGNIFRRLGQRDHVKFQVLSEDVTF
ncbi:hypothetical protein Ocin01_18166 [Orchesella cincta]|uniref:Uncharacterized protein n=1 Tax=Orchesella cincta TaxID=48709 RepID=A0A1D2M6D2_ORCCI|nr:hypothetical protein Ocin01_18166 [Orchesella cincta]